MQHKNTIDYIVGFTLAGLIILLDIFNIITLHN